MTPAPAPAPHESVEAAIDAFAAGLRALRDNAPAGAPTFEQLIGSRRIPRSTAYAVLGGKRLPSQDSLRTIVEAWGGDMQYWVDKRAAILRAQRALPPASNPARPRPAKAGERAEPRPVKIGGIVALAFRVTGYVHDDRGELVAQLERVDHKGNTVAVNTLNAVLSMGNAWRLARPDILHGITTLQNPLKET